MKLVGKLLGFIWFVAFGMFIVLSFLPKEQQSELAKDYAVHFEELLQAFLSSPWFILFFIAMWIFISFKLGKDSGWNKLAKYFSENYIEPKNTKFKSGSGYIGKVSHNGMLKIYADEIGFYIKTMFPFRIGHKPLLIPWNEISQLNPETALVSNKTPVLLKKIAAILTRKKYMKIVLHNLPEQNIVIHWEDDFNKFIPSYVTRGG